MSRSRGRGRGRKRGRDTDNGWGAWGGYMNAKIQKLQDQFHLEGPGEASWRGEKTDIFKDIAIFVNGYTDPSASELKKLMMLHGGVFHQYYGRSRVTHIIASNLPNSKVMKLTDQKVVKPAWITDSIAARKLLSCEPYLLYTSRTKLQPGLAFKNCTSSTSATMSEQKSVNIEMPTSPKDDDVLASKSASPEVGDADKQLSPLASKKLPVAMETEGACSEAAMEFDDFLVDLASDTDLFEDSEEGCDTSMKSCDQSIVEELDTRVPSKVSMRSKPVLPPNKDSHNDISKGSNIKQKSDKTPPQVFQSKSTGEKSHKPTGKAGDVGFMAEFYTNSRLHHLSTWGAEWKAYVKKLQSEPDSHFPGLEGLRKRVAAGQLASQARGNVGKPQRVIMHIDMDSFFVSVGLRNRPELKGKPIAVTHSKGHSAKDRPGADLAYEQNYYKNRALQKRQGRKNKYTADELERNPDLLLMQDDDGEDGGASTEVFAVPSVPSAPVENTFHSMAEIASCSYEARQAGVKNGMFMGQAMRLCPDLQTIPYDFEGYQEVSQILYDTVASYTHVIEAVSCDEMMVDLTDILADLGISPDDLALTLREEIKGKTGCNCSAGMGPNLLLARLATRLAKPNGQHYVSPASMDLFMKTISCRDLPGVGYTLSSRLEALGVITCAQLQQKSLAELQKEFGPKTGQSLYTFSRGQDDRPIKVEKERKSVSAEINYGIRFTHDREVAKFLEELSEEVHSRLDKIKVKGKTVTLKLKVRKKGAPKETAKFMGHGVCDNVAKSVTLPLATDESKVIATECLSLVRALKIPAEDFRGIGIQVSRLEPAVVGLTAATRGTQSILNFAHKRDSPQAYKKNSPIKQKSAEISKVETNTEVEVVRKIPEPKPRELPPLPCLPDLTSPPASQTRSRLRSRSSSQSRSQTLTPVRPPPVDEMLDLPSPSQVDLDVLKELPLNIRQQIERALKKKREAAVPESVPSRPQRLTRGNSQQAGCSHWMTPPSLDLEEKVHSDLEQEVKVTEISDPPRQKKELVEALPAFSQIDPTCFDALPADLQRELRQAYEKEQNVSRPVSVKEVIGAHPVMQAARCSPSKTSPTKSHNSPNKAGPGSPSFKVPPARGRGRGRPRGRGRGGRGGRGRGTQPGGKELSPKKLEFLHSGVEKQVSRHVVEDTKRSTSSSVAMATEAAPPAPDPDTALSEPEVPKVNLCGAVTLVEVKAIVREWIESCLSPEEEDLCQFVQYLCDLVDDKNLEQVYLLLKYFKRCLNHANEGHSWNEKYDYITSHVQSLVKAVYNSKLALI